MTHKKSIIKRYNVLTALIIVLVWLLLYCPNIRTAPSWYGDEGLALTAGLNLSHGIPAHGSFWNTFWNSYAPYQPFYEYLIGWAARLSGEDILGARLVNACFALITALFINFYGRKILGILFSFGSALLFLTFEQNVIHFRWVFTHNLIALGYAIAFIGLSGKKAYRSDAVAGLGLAISALALPLSIYGVVAAFILRIRSPRSWFLIAGPYFFVTLASLGLGYFLYPQQGFVWTDLVETFRFYSDASRENGGSFKVIGNLLRFFSQDMFHCIGLLMLLICLRGSTFAIGAGGIIISFLLLQNRQNLTVFYYQAIILTPILAIAYGVGIQEVSRFFRRVCVNSKTPLLICRYLLVAIALVSFIHIFPSILNGKIKTRIDYWATQSIPEVEAAASWINERSSSDDLIICHQNIAWLLKVRSADYLQVTSWQGYSTWPFKRPLRQDQFRFEPNLSDARFAVIADIDERWTFNQPNVHEVIKLFDSENWPVVWSGTHYKVLQNPKYPDRHKSSK